MSVIFSTFFLPYSRDILQRFSSKLYYSLQVNLIRDFIPNSVFLLQPITQIPIKVFHHSQLRTECPHCRRLYFFTLLLWRKRFQTNPLLTLSLLTWLSLYIGRIINSNPPTWPHMNIYLLVLSPVTPLGPYLLSSLYWLNRSIEFSPRTTLVSFTQCNLSFLRRKDSVLPSTFLSVSVTILSQRFPVLTPLKRDFPSHFTLSLSKWLSVSFSPTQPSNFPLDFQTLFSSYFLDRSRYILPHPWWGSGMDSNL